MTVKVLDFPEVNSSEIGDLLYLVRGTGIESDKSIHPENLKTSILKISTPSILTQTGLQNVVDIYSDTYNGTDYHSLICWKKTGNTGTAGTTNFANGLIYDGDGNERKIYWTHKMDPQFYGLSTTNTDAGNKLAIENAWNYAKDIYLHNYDGVDKEFLISGTCEITVESQLSCHSDQGMKITYNGSTAGEGVLRFVSSGPNDYSKTLVELDGLLLDNNATTTDRIHGIVIAASMMNLIIRKYRPVDLTGYSIAFDVQHGTTIAGEFQSWVYTQSMSISDYRSYACGGFLGLTGEPNNPDVRAQGFLACTLCELRNIAFEGPVKDGGLTSLCDFRGIREVTGLNAVFEGSVPSNYPTVFVYGSNASVDFSGYLHIEYYGGLLTTHTFKADPTGTFYGSGQVIPLKLNQTNDGRVKVETGVKAYVRINELHAYNWTIDDVVFDAASDVVDPYVVANDLGYVHIDNFIGQDYPAIPNNLYGRLTVNNYLYAAAAASGMMIPVIKNKPLISWRAEVELASITDVPFVGPSGDYFSFSQSGVASSSLGTFQGVPVQSFVGSNNTTPPFIQWILRIPLEYRGSDVLFHCRYYVDSPGSDSNFRIGYMNEEEKINITPVKLNEWNDAYVVCRLEDSYMPIQGRVVGQNPTLGLTVHVASVEIMLGSSNLDRDIRYS